MNNILISEKKENITEIKFQYEKTSSMFVVVPFKKDLTCSDSSQEKFLDSSTYKPKRRDVSPYEKYLVEDKIKRERKELDQLIVQLTQELIMELKYFSVEDNNISSAEREILHIEKQYSFRILGEVLQNIYVQFYDDPNMLVGICKGLGRFDLEEVSPWGPIMLPGLLLHKNEMVKEYAVSLVENWSDITLLPILKNLDCSAVWLQEYISDVIQYLEESNVLHKKVI